MKRSNYIAGALFCISHIINAEVAPLKELQSIDFLTSMGWHNKENEKFKNFHFYSPTLKSRHKLALLKGLKALYERTIHIADDPLREAVIPKIIHQIWVGPKQPPALLQESQKSIQKLHPDWEYKLWTDADIPHLNLHNQKLYDRAKNWGAKADILRYELLYRMGGIYLDIDFICVKPLDDLLKFDMWTTIQPLDCHGDIANGALGAVPGNAVLQHCILSLDENWRRHEKNGNILQMVGPLHLQRSFAKFIGTKDMNIIALPTSFFYPISFSQRLIALNASTEDDKQRIFDAFVKPETFAVHCWAGSWWD